MTHTIFQRATRIRTAAFGMGAAMLFGMGCTPAADGLPTAEERRSPEAIFIEFADSAPNVPVAAAEPVSHAPIPARMEESLTAGDMQIIVDAAVIPPAQQSYPVYRLNCTATQDFTDRAIAVLLEGNTLYEETGVETKAYFGELIEYYTHEREHAVNVEQRRFFEEQIELYTERQKTAPDSATLTPADTTLTARQTQSTAMRFGDAVKTADGGTRYEWSETARQRAEAAGYSAVAGVGWQKSGRKVFLTVENEGERGRIWFGPPEGEESDFVSAPLTYGMEQAEDRAEALLVSLGIDAALLNAEEHFHEDGSRRLYAFDYVPHYAGQDAGDQPRIGRVADGAAPGLYAYSDTIRISMDGSGIVAFTWDDVRTADAVLAENAPLLPWETVEARIAEGLRQLRSFADAYREEPFFKGETARIDTVRFAVRQTEIDGVWYSLPVWELTGTLEWAFDPAAYTGYLPLDANGVYTGFRPENNDGLVYSFLTVPAVDLVTLLQ